MSKFKPIFNVDSLFYLFFHCESSSVIHYKFDQQQFTANCVATLVCNCSLMYGKISPCYIKAVQSVVEDIQNSDDTFQKYLTQE